MTREGLKITCKQLAEELFKEKGLFPLARIRDYADCIMSECPDVKPWEMVDTLTLLMDKHGIMNENIIDAIFRAGEDVEDNILEEIATK